MNDQDKFDHHVARPYATGERWRGEISSDDNFLTAQSLLNAELIRSEGGMTRNAGGGRDRAL